MIVILGLIILVAAVVVAVAGVLGNAGVAHALTHGFAVFGTGRLHGRPPRPGTPPLRTRNR